MHTQLTRCRLQHLSEQHTTWSVTQREEYRLRVFEIRVLRRISGPDREAVAGGWQRLRGTDHSEDVGVDGRIILEWILGKYGEICGLHLSLSR